MRGRLEVEIAQRPVQVVGAPDGPARLHAGVTRHRQPRDGAKRPGRRREEPRSSMAAISSGADRLDAAARSGCPCGPRPGAARPARRRRIVLELAENCGSAHREVDLEGGVEGAPVVGGLHQGRAEGELDRLAVLEGQVADRLGGVGLFVRPRRASPARRSSATKPMRTSSTTGRRRARVRSRRRRRAPWPRPRCRSGT